MTYGYGERKILVFGATGQQGGSVASALLNAGWQVRAVVRDPASSKSKALRQAGVGVLQGDFADGESMQEAVHGMYGIFSVQPSSGQGAELGLSDEEEERYGKAIADLAVQHGIKHLVYTSTNAVSNEPTGMGHFDSKARIEAHIRTLPMTATIIRPAAFMEMLLMPGFGLDQGRFNFLMKPDQAMQFLAVEDIGKFVAAIFADPERYSGQAFEIASDSVTGHDLEAMFTQAAGRSIPYARFSEDILAANPFLRKLTALVDAGRLTGKADIAALRDINPEMQSFQSWLTGSGRQAFFQALGTPGEWAYGHE